MLFDMKKEMHSNNIVRGMQIMGYSARDVLCAYPCFSIDDIEQLWKDIALSQERPVLPYGLLGVFPCKSQFFNFSQQGFRSNGHDAIWPPKKDAFNIFIFGGSTVLGFNVSDKQTIPSVLERICFEHYDNVRIYNFGQNSYTSRNEAHALLTLIDKGCVPDAALFLDGFNDCQYAFGNPGLVQLLNTLYKSEKARRRMGYIKSIWNYARDSYNARTNPLPDVFSWELSEEYGDFAGYYEDKAIDDVLDSDINKKPSALDNRAAELVWRRYLTSVELIRALARRFQFKVAFTWQPVATHKTSPEQRLVERTFYVFRNAALAGPIYRSLSAHRLLEFKTAEDFFDLSELHYKYLGPVFIDICHYSPTFINYLANNLYDIVVRPLFLENKGVNYQ